MTFCGSRAEKTARSSLHCRWSVIGRRLGSRITEYGLREYNERGAFKSRVKLKLSSAKPEVIGVRVQAGVNPVEWWKVLQTVVVVHEGQRQSERLYLLGEKAVSTGRLGRMELDEFIKGSAVSPSCHLSPCSQTPINGRNTSKTTFSTRPRKQGCI